MTNSSKSMDYAKILFEVCVEAENTTTALYDLNKLRTMKSEEVGRLLNLPVISPEIKIKLIDSLEQFDISKYILNLIKILIQRKDYNYFPEIIEEYKKLYQDKEGIKIVNVYTAKKISGDNLNVLIKELETKLEKFIIISPIVDPELIGGIKIEYDGKEVNNTIKKHLNDFINQM